MAGKPAMRASVRLRYVAVADFRKSEANNFRAIDQKIRDQLSGSDVVCLRSQSGDQVVFVYAPSAVQNAAGADLEVVASTRLRLPKGRGWDPRMLSEYAAAVGLELIGLKKFADYLAHLTEQLEEE